MSNLVRLAVVPVAVLALAACGGSSPSSTAATTGSAAQPTGAPGGGQGFGGIDFTAVQACLKAAGISVPTPSGTFRRPTDMPSGTRPTDLPRPSGTGGFRGGNGGGRGIFQSKAAQAALKACGITIPTGGPRPSATSPAA